MDRLRDEPDLVRQLGAEEINRDDLPGIAHVVVHKCDSGAGAAHAQQFGIDDGELCEVLANHPKDTGVVDLTALLARLESVVDLRQGIVSGDQVENSIEVGCPADLRVEVPEIGKFRTILDGTGEHILPQPVDMPSPTPR